MDLGISARVLPRVGHVSAVGAPGIQGFQNFVAAFLPLAKGALLSVPQTEELVHQLGDVWFTTAGL